MIYTKLKQKVTSLFILLCLLFASSAEALKVISSNLLAEYAYDQNLTKNKTEKLKVAFEQRTIKFNAFIKKEKPDIVCLQECHDDSWKKTITEFAQENDYTLSEELNPDGRAGMRTHLAILTNNKTIELDATVPVRTDKHAKIMSLKCTDKKTKQNFILLNIHAPWGQKLGKKFDPKNPDKSDGRADNTDRYCKYVEYATRKKLPIIAVGDWNTDKPADGKTNDNQQILFENVFTQANQFEDISNELAHTARSVHAMDDAQKIDYVVTRGFKKPQLVTTEPPHSPQGFNLLLPHTDNSTGATSFDPESPDNHWSDHAAVIVDFDIAEQNKQKPVKPEQQQPQQRIDNKNDKGNKKPINKKNGANPRFKHKGKALITATGLTILYATHQACQKKIKDNKDLNNNNYLELFAKTFAELTVNSIKSPIKNAKEQPLFMTALATLIGGGIALNCR